MIGLMPRSHQERSFWKTRRLHPLRWTPMCLQSAQFYRTSQASEAGRNGAAIHLKYSSQNREMGDRGYQSMVGHKKDLKPIACFERTGWRGTFRGSSDRKLASWHALSKSHQRDIERNPWISPLSSIT